MMIIPQFSFLLKQERQRHGWTQQELADHLGVARVTISRWEAGAMAPVPHWRSKLCKLFQKQMEELFPADYTSSVVNAVLSPPPEELQMKRLEFQKRSIEYIIDIANKIIDVMEPSCGAKIRSDAIQQLLLRYQDAGEEEDRSTLFPRVEDIRRALNTAEQLIRGRGNGQQALDINASEALGTSIEYSKFRHVLVAPLGGQPQVVTFTLDLLLQGGFPISEVIVLHPKVSSSMRLDYSLQRLNAEFESDHYPGAPYPISFRSHTLELDGQAIEDITNDAHADGTLDTIHRLLSDLKRRGYHIHLSVSGGRRLMALLAISVAALNFDRHDHIWHLYTPELLRERVDENRIMHLKANAGIKLIQGPFLSLGKYIANPTHTFRNAQAEKRAQLDAQERACCAEVVQQATAAQLKVLSAFARGLRPQQVAEELCITLVTVNTHKTVLLSHCRVAWNIPDRERLDYHFLVAKFGSYFLSD